MDPVLLVPRLLGDVLNTSVGIMDELATVVGEQEASSEAAEITKKATAGEISEKTIQEVRELKPEKPLDRDTAYSLSKGLVDKVYEDKSKIREERMKQARLTFYAALVLSVIGALILFAGVALLLFNQNTSAGAISAGTGAVTEVASVLLFALNRETNNRVDETGRELRTVELAQVGLEIISKIENPTERDKATARLLNEIKPSQTVQSS